jgi:hypothetical protein
VNVLELLIENSRKGTERPRSMVVQKRKVFMVR